MADNAELVRNAYRSFREGDIPAVLDALAERVEWDVTSILPQGGSWRGRDGVQEFFDLLGSQWADLALEIEQLLSDGDHVVAIGRAAGRLREHGDAAAGYLFAHVFTLTDGAVTRFREWADPDEELREHMR
jgi:ketosteroid isomerase-like protein